jgi:hypothetical protein
VRVRVWIAVPVLTVAFFALILTVSILMEPKMPPLHCTTNGDVTMCVRQP